MLTPKTETDVPSIETESQKPNNYFCGGVSCHLTVENINSNFTIPDTWVNPRINISLISPETLNALVQKINEITGAEPSFTIFLTVVLPKDKSDQLSLKAKLDTFKQIQKEKVKISLAIPTMFESSYWYSSTINTSTSKYSLEELFFVLDTTKEVPQITELDLSSLNTYRIGKQAQLEIVKRLSKFQAITNLKFWHNLDTLSMSELQELYWGILSIENLRYLQLEGSHIYKLPPAEILKISEFVFYKTQLESFDFRILHSSYGMPSSASSWTTDEKALVARAELLAACKSKSYEPKIFSQVIEASEVDLPGVVYDFFEHNPTYLNLLLGWLSLSLSNNPFLKSLSEDKVKVLASPYLRLNPDKLNVVMSLCEKYMGLREVVLEFMEAHPEYLHLLHDTRFTQSLLDKPELVESEQRRLEDIVIASLKITQDTRAKVLRLCEFYPSLRHYQFIHEEMEKLKKLSVSAYYCSDLTLDLTNYRESEEINAELLEVLKANESKFTRLTLSVVVKDQTEAELAAIGKLINTIHALKPVSLSIHVQTFAESPDRTVVFMSRIHSSLSYAVKLDVAQAGHSKNNVESEKCIKGMSKLSENTQITKLELTRHFLDVLHLDAVQLGDLIEALVKNPNLQFFKVGAGAVKVRSKDVLRIAEAVFANTALISFQIEKNCHELNTWSVEELHELAIAEVMLASRIDLKTTYYGKTIFSHGLKNTKIDLLKVVESFLQKYPVYIKCLRLWLSNSDNVFLNDLNEGKVWNIVFDLLKKHPESLADVINLCAKYLSLREVFLEFVEEHPEQLGLLNTSTFTTPLTKYIDLRMSEQGRVEKIARVSLKTTPATQTAVLGLCEFYPNLKQFKFMYSELEKLEKLELPHGSSYGEFDIDLTSYIESADAKEKLLSLIAKKKIFFQNLNFRITINDQSEAELAGIAHVVNEVRTIKPCSLIITVPNISLDHNKFFGFMSVIHKSIPCILVLSVTSADKALGKLGSNEFLGVMKKLGADKRIVRLGLNNHQLSNLGVETLNVGLGFLAENPSLSTLALKNNGLVKFGFELINQLLVKFGEKVELILGVSDTSLTDHETIIKTWTLLEREQFFRFVIKGQLMRSQNYSHNVSFINEISFVNLQDYFSEEEARGVIVECFNELPDHLPRLSEYVLHTPCLRELDPAWLKSAVMKFIKSREYNSNQELAELRRKFPYLKESNSELKAYLSILEARQNPIWHEDIKLSSISTTEEKTEEAVSLATKILARMKFPKAIVELAEQSDEGLKQLAAVINQLKFPVGHTFRVIELQITTHGLKRVLSFLNLIHNPTIDNYSIVDNKLQASDEGSFLEILKILSEKQCSLIDLSNNNLGIFKKEALAEGLKGLAKSNIDNIDLGDNSLGIFGFDFILELSELFKKRPYAKFFSVGVTSSGCSDVDSSHMAALAGNLDPIQKLQLSKVYYRSILRDIKTMNHYNNTDVIYDFGLEDEQILPTLEDIVLENATIRKGDEFIGLNVQRWATLQLKPKSMVSLIKKIVSSGTEFYSFGGFKLESIHRLEAFLYICEYSNEFFTDLDRFDLFPAKDPASEMLEAWKGVFLEEKDKPQAAEIMEEDDLVVIPNQNFMHPEFMQTEEDLDIVSARVREFTLPKLKVLCDIHLSKALFVEPILKHLMTYKEDEEGALPLINMAAWFTWVCSRLLIDPKIMQLYDEDPKVKSTVNKVLKEILNFASPQLRYTLTGFFFDQVCLDNNKRYFPLVEGCGVNSLLPTLALCKILFQEKDEEEQKNCVGEINALLATVSFRAYEGRHYRSLVSAILAVAEDLTIKPLLKLQLMTKILTKSENRKVLEEKFIRVFDLFKVDKKDDEALKKLGNDKKELEGKRRKLTSSGPGDSEIQMIESSLKVIKEKITAIYAQNNASFKQSQFDTLWHALRIDLEPEFLDQVKSYFPKGRLCNSDFRTFQRRASEDLHMFFKDQDFRQRISLLIMVQGLAKLQRLADFRGLDQSNFIVQARLVLKQLFCLSEDQALFYNAIFSKCHNEAALLTYFSKIITLKGEGANKLHDLFKEFIKLVLSDNNNLEFYRQRYDRKDNEHLTTIFTGRSDLKAVWRKGESRGLITFVKEHNLIFKPYIPNFPEFLDKKIFGHNHLDSSFYVFLRQYLDAVDDLERKKAIEAAQKLMLQQSQIGNTQSKVVQTKKQHALIQHECIQLLEASKVASDSYNVVLNILGRIKRALQFSNNTANQFKHDVDALIKGLKGSRRTPNAQDWTGWTIVDTDHFWSLFMAGTDIEGSCQAVDGTPSLNKCLMAYVMDGKNRMLAIQNAAGVTVARCILRLLWDSQNDRPVLFLEEIYPDTIRRDLYDALVKLALLRAEKLNVTLVTLESTDASYQYEGEITALGNEFVSWEYVDAIYSAQDEGKFTIPKAQVLFAAKPEIDLVSRAENVLEFLTSGSPSHVKAEDAHSPDRSLTFLKKLPEEMKGNSTLNVDLPTELALDQEERFQENERTPVQNVSYR